MNRARDGSASKALRRDADSACGRGGDGHNSLRLGCPLRFTSPSLETLCRRNDQNLNHFLIVFPGCVIVT